MNKITPTVETAPVALEDFVQRLSTSVLQSIEECEGCKEHGLDFHLQAALRGAVRGTLYFIGDAFPGIDEGDMFSDWADALEERD